MSKKGQQFGSPPCKIRIEGEDGFKPEQQVILELLQGEISRFYAGCVQQRQLSGQSGHKQIKALPDGRQLRYTYNGGQETIDVRLSPKSHPKATQAESPEKPTHDFVLAIDVLFESEQHVAGDVTSYTEVVVTPGDPGVPGEPFPSDWDMLFASSSPLFSPEDPLTEPWDWESPGRGPIGPSKYYKAIGFFDGYVGPYTVTPTGIPLFSEVDIDGMSVSETPFTLVYGAPYMDYSSAPSGTHLMVEFGWTVPGATVPIPPTPADIRKYYIRDKYTYFDTFKVVGLQVGDPAEGGYTAKSAGSVDDPDNRLKSLTGYPTAKSVDRTLTAADAPPNLLGHCFVARPRDSIDLKTVIDVYAATCDVQKTNSYPDGEGSTLAVDDPTFDYAVKQDFRWTIRVREFVDGGPVAIGVTTKCEGETQHFTAPEIEVLTEAGIEYEPGYNIPPTVEDAPVVTADARTSSWAFAALSAWEDTGDNTDPTLGSDDPEAKLGKLLDELSGSSTITGPEPLERKLLDAPAWEQPVEAMTKIATITWTPSPTGGKGSASIEAA